MLTEKNASQRDNFQKIDGFRIMHGNAVNNPGYNDGTMEDASGKKSGYQVMALKWRPSTFAEVVGQQHIVRSLSNAIKLNRIAGAYLFCGTRGVGKTSMARIFSRSINCETGATVTPCGTCRNCREIADGNSMDVVEIDGASNNGVDNIREIRDHLQYAPVKCRMKIYIIDEVHMLSGAAFNAFLKTLEEPPPHTVFIMATTEQNKLPDTVLSRCQVFEFRALSDQEIAGRLQKIIDSDGIKITPGAVLMIARRAEGSMRDAQSLLDQAASYAAETIDEELLGMVLGLVSREKIWSVLGAVTRKEVDETLRQLHDLYYAGFEVAVIVRELFEAVRALTIVKVSNAPEKILKETDDALAAMKQLVEGVTPGRLQQYYDILLRAKSQAATAGNPLSVLEMALIKMVRLDDVLPVAELLERLKGMPAAAPQPQASTAAPRFAPTATPQRTATVTGARQPAPQGYDAPPPPAAAPAAGDPWEAIRTLIKEKKPLLAASLDKMVFSMEGGKAVLGYPEDQSFIRDQCEQNRALIEDSLQSAAGRKLAVAFSPVPKAMLKETQVKKPAMDNAMRRQMLNEPVIQKAVDLFDGTPGFEEER